MGGCLSSGWGYLGPGVPGSPPCERGEHPNSHTELSLEPFTLVPTDGIDGNIPNSILSSEYGDVHSGPYQWH